MNIFLSGKGYNQEVENDVLLLDISNNDQYIWTTNFEPSSPPTPSSPVSSLSAVITAINIGIIIEPLIGIILLTIGSFFLYKQYKVRKEQNNTIPTPGESDQYPQEIIKIQNTYYNHGQEIIPIPENTVQQRVDQSTDGDL